MYRTIFISMMVIAFLGSMAQEAVSFNSVDTMPIFPGCEEVKDENERTSCFNMKLAEHIINHFEYPELAMKKNIEGKVYVTFVISMDGSVRDIEVALSAHASLDEAAVKVIKSLPQFNPATRNGKPVPVALTVPINFRLS